MGILIKGMDEIPEDGAVLVVRHDNGKAYIKHARTYGYSMELVKLPAIQPVAKDINVLTNDCISRQMAIDTIMGQPPEPHYPSWYAAQIEKLPAAQPDHTADVSKKVSISCAHENDLVSRKAAIEALARMMPRSYTPDGSHPADEEIFRAQEVFADCIEALEILPSAQPELIAQDAYVRGFEQGRTQGMVDSQGGKKQRKVLITTTYNEMGIIIDTKAEEVVQPDHVADIGKKVERTNETAQNVSDSDLVFRKAAIEALARMMPHSYTPDGSHPADEEIFRAQEVFADCIEALEILPSAQPEQRWAPVTERLPENDNEVLITVWDAEDDYVEVYKGFYQGHEWWTQWCHGCSKIKDEPCGENIVIAWMPLPEPYRGGEKG